MDLGLRPDVDFLSSARPRSARPGWSAAIFRPAPSAFGSSDRFWIGVSIVGGSSRIPYLCTSARPHASSSHSAASRTPSGSGLPSPCLTHAQRPPVPFRAGLPSSRLMWFSIASFGLFDLSSFPSLDDLPGRLVPHPEDRLHRLKSGLLPQALRIPGSLPSSAQTTRLLHQPPCAQVLHLPHRFPDRAFRLRGHVRDLAPYHPAGSACPASGSPRGPSPVLAVPVYRDVITDPEDLVHLMRNINNGYAFSFKSAIILNGSSTSDSVRAEVGSSMITIDESRDTALTISTICILRRSGLSSSHAGLCPAPCAGAVPRSRHTFSCGRSGSFSSVSLPSHTLSHTERSYTGESSDGSSKSPAPNLLHCVDL